MSAPRHFVSRRAVTLREPPDLVVQADWSFKVLGDKVAQLEALGIPVLVLDYNAQEPAKELADLYAGRVADIQRRVGAAG